MGFASAARMNAHQPPILTTSAIQPTPRLFVPHSIRTPVLCPVEWIHTPTSDRLYTYVFYQGTCPLPQVVVTIQHKKHLTNTVPLAIVAYGICIVPAPDQHLAKPPSFNVRCVKVGSICDLVDLLSPKHLSRPGKANAAASQPNAFRPLDSAQPK